MERYDNYKDSGVDWIGQIPEHWEVQRLASYFDERRVKVSDKEYPALSVTKNGICGQLENVAKTDNGDNRKLVLDGDFVINSRSDRKGSSGLSSLCGSVSLINIVLAPRKHLLIGQFAHFLLKSHYFIEEYYRNGRGIVADLWTTRYSEMKLIKLAIPPISEQQAIAAYLDKETGKLDAAVEKLERMVEVLKERKQLIISKAVTRGLDDSVPLKDSGVDWIGQIPEHWNLRKIKSVSIFNPSKKTANLDLVGYAPMECIRTGAIEIRSISFKQLPTGLTYFENGDLVVAKVTPCFENNNIAIAKNLTNGCAFGSSELFVFRPTNICDKFLFYYFQDEQFKNKCCSTMRGTGGLKRVQSDFVLNAKIPYPDLSEQQAIAAYLDEKVGKLDEAIEKQLRMIELLKERKQILISDVVTGKIKVA